MGNGLVSSDAGAGGPGDRPREMTPLPFSAVKIQLFGIFAKLQTTLPCCPLSSSSVQVKWGWVGGWDGAAEGPGTYLLALVCTLDAS